MIRLLQTLSAPDAVCFSDLMLKNRRAGMRAATVLTTVIISGIRTPVQGVMRQRFLAQSFSKLIAVDQTAVPMHYGRPRPDHALATRKEMVSRGEVNQKYPKSISDAGVICW